MSPANLGPPMVPPFIQGLPVADSGLSGARKEKRALTSCGWPPGPQAIAWIRMLPVPERARKQAPCVLAGSRRRATLGFGPTSAGIADS